MCCCIINPIKPEPPLCEWLRVNDKNKNNNNKNWSKWTGVAKSSAVARHGMCEVSEWVCMTVCSLPPAISFRPTWFARPSRHMALTVSLSFHERAKSLFSRPPSSTSSLSSSSAASASSSRCCCVFLLPRGSPPAKSSIVIALVAFCWIKTKQQRQRKRKGKRKTTKRVKWAPPRSWLIRSIGFALFVAALRLFIHLFYFPRCAPFSVYSFCLLI